MSALGQPAPPAAPPAAAAPQKTTHSVDQLHTVAMRVDKDLHTLAVGLASAGADPQAVKAITGFAGVIHQIAGKLGKATPPPKPSMQDAADHMRQGMNQPSPGGPTQ